MRRLIVASLLLAVAALGAGQVAAVRTSQAFSLIVPPTAQVDRAFAVELRLPALVSAVDGRVLVAGDSMEFVGVAAGRARAFQPQESRLGVAFGVYGLTPRAGGTSIDIVLVPQISALVQVRVIVDTAADAMGRRVLVGPTDLLATVRVGQGMGRVAAPSGSGQPYARSAPPDSVIAPTIDEIEAAWERSHSTGSVCDVTGRSLGDANVDACIDIADVQATFASARGIVPEAQAGSQRNSEDRESPRQLTAGVVSIVVTSAADNADASVGDGICADQTGQCTLRAAIAEANANPGSDRIEFNMPGAAPVLIAVGSNPLPVIQDHSGGLAIDGYSQPGSKVNTASVGSNAVPGIELTGRGDNPRSAGLRVTSSGNDIRGLLINNFYRGIVLDGANAQDNRVVGNLINYTRKGAAHSFWGYSAIQISNGAHHNVIGAPALADRNMGQSLKGIYLYGPATDSNTVQNNVLCMRTNGNRSNDCRTGIDLDFGPKSNVIGGMGVGERNVIGGTKLNGIEISHGWDPSGADVSSTWQNNGNHVVGNWIGFRANGAFDKSFLSGKKTPKAGHTDSNGINIYDGSNENVIENNWVGAAWDGIQVISTNSTGNIIRGNHIGESPMGHDAPPKRFGIVARNGTSTNTIDSNTINGAGVYGIALMQPDVKRIRMTRNIITNMTGMPIYLAPDPADHTTGANDMVPAPVITSATPGEVSGSAAQDAIVELFRATATSCNDGLPIEFIGSTPVSAAGAWSLPVSLAEGDRVTSLQILPNGNTSTLGAATHVQAAPVDRSALASDTFSRVCDARWGSADSGGAYDLLGNSNTVRHEVADGTGSISISAAGATGSALLHGLVARDVDMRLKVAVNKVPSAGNYFIYAVARRGADREYRPRMLLNANGSISVHASAVVNGSEASIGSAVVVGGLTQAPGAFVWLRAQVTGASPTTIRVKAWADGQPEPASWQYSATDSRSALQGPGSVGLRVYVGSKATNTPALFRFDDLTVGSP